MSSEKWLYNSQTGNVWVSISGKVPEGAVELNPPPSEAHVWNGLAWQPPAPEVALARMVDAATAVVQAHVDETARERRYTDGVHCASYATSQHAKYGAEAVAFVVWRDAVWDVMEQLEQDVAAGQAQPPTDEAALLGLLPAMEWPE